MNISLHNYSIEIVSVSTNTELERLFAYMYGSMICKTSYILLLILTHILGPLLLLGIIAFEKRGGDPQKRNIINRLQSIGISSHIIFTIIIGLIRSWRGIFGLIDFDVMIWIECLAYTALSNCILIFDEMAIIQFMYIIVWKRVKGVDDEFWALFLSLATASVSCWMSIVEHLPDKLYIIPLKLNTANLNETLDDIR